MGAQGDIERPSFDGAPRWAIDQDDIRLRMSDRFASRIPTIARGMADRLVASPRGSRLRHWLLTRALVAGWAAYDEGDFDFLRRAYAPDVRVEVRADRPMDIRSTYEGTDALLEMLSTYRQLVSGMESSLSEVVDLGGPLVAAVVSSSGAATHTGLRMPFGSGVHIYEFRGGLIVEQWHCPDEDDAAAVLSERLALERD